MMKKLLFLVAAAIAAGVSLAIPEPGLKQYALSGFSSGKYLTPDNWTTFKPSDPVVMPGALMAQEASINGRTWEGNEISVRQWKWLLVRGLHEARGRQDLFRLLAL